MSERIYGRNVCPRDKPHLQKLGWLWVQHWPDGWKQYISTRGGRAPQILPRNVVPPR